MRKSKGFTLIEILVALMIFAIMGVLAAKSLQSIIRIHKSLKKVDKQTSQLMMTMTLLRRDISEAINRPVMSDGGAPIPAFIASGTDMTFTRTGLLNPFNQSRQSNMQRIGYALQGGALVRLTWDVLDATANTKPESQTLLNGVQSIEWQYVDSNGEKSKVFPPPDNAAVSANPQKKILPLPTVVLMVMHLKEEGVVQGIFPIPARGADASTLPS